MTMFSLKATRLAGFSFLLAGISGGALAQTNVQLYGVVDAYAGSTKRSDQGDSTAAVNGGGLTTSYWGVRGTEDLGGSLKAIFTLESFFQPDSGAVGRNATDPLFAKNAWVGLSSSFGQLILGRQTIPLLQATAASNPFGASLQFSPLLVQTWLPTFGRNVLGDSVWNNAIQVATPTFGGWKGALVYSLGEVQGTNGKNNLSLNASYAGGPYSGTVLAQKTKAGPGFTNAIREQTVVMGGATYDLQAVKLYGSLYRTDADGADIKDRTGQLGVSVPVGAGKVLASWANSRTETRGAPDVKRNTYAAGYDYSLSARTDVYAIAMFDKLSNRGGASSFGVGARHTF